MLIYILKKSIEISSYFKFNYLYALSDFHNLKIVNNTFFFIFEGGLIFLSKGEWVVCV